MKLRSIGSADVVAQQPELLRDQRRVDHVGREPQVHQPLPEHRRRAVEVRFEVEPFAEGAYAETDERARPSLDERLRITGDLTEQERVGAVEPQEVDRAAAGLLQAPLQLDFVRESEVRVLGDDADVEIAVVPQLTPSSRPEQECEA